MVGRYEELIGSMDRYGISRAFMFCLDEPDRHPQLPGRQRPVARVRGPLGRPTRPVRAARARRGPDRGGAPLPRPRGARDQAPSARSEVPAQRRAARARLRARGRARRPDPHPRRPRPAADRGGARATRRRARGDAAHPRPRRHRRPRQPRVPLLGQARRLLRHLGLERHRPARAAAARAAGADRLRLGLPVRPAARLAAPLVSASPASRASTTGSCGTCSPATRTGSRTARSRSSRRSRRAPTSSSSRSRRRASTSTSRWRCRSSSPGSRTASARSGSRSTRPRSPTAPTGRSSPLIRELLEAARDLWRTLPEAEDDSERRLVARTSVRLLQIADTVAVTST